MPDQLCSMSEAIRDALDEALELDESVVLLGEDIGDEAGGGVFHCTSGLSTKYGNRVRSTPIAEEAIVGAAVGAAIGGMRPVVEIMFMNFMHGAMDQLCNHAAKLRYMSGGQTNVPMTVRVTGFGPGLAAQHSETLEAWFCHTPGLKVVVASNPQDAKGLLLSCIFDDDPCLFIENPRLSRGPVSPPPTNRVPIGKATVRREGSDVTVVTYGNAVRDVDDVAARLGEDGVDVEVIDLRTLVPWDYSTVFESVTKTRRVVVVQSSVRAFGVGGEIASRINEDLFHSLDAPVARIGARFGPVPYNARLGAASLFSSQDLENAVRATVQYRR